LTPAPIIFPQLDERAGKSTCLGTNGSVSDFFSSLLDVMMRESMRADLDGDGWEEILVFHYVSAARSGGTLGAGGAFMAKVGEDGLLHMKPYPPTQAE
jgi:hypothetical protein